MDLLAAVMICSVLTEGWHGRRPWWRDLRQLRRRPTRDWASCQPPSRRPGMTDGDGDKKVSGMTGMGTNQAAGRRPPWWAALAAVVLVVAMPVATWWLVGDQTEPSMKRRLHAAAKDPAIQAGLDPDYMYRPFDIAPATERTAGVVAVVLVVAAVVVLVVAWRTGRLHVGWWGVLGLLSLVGAGCGWGWRIMTAAVDGGNIGGAAVLDLGGPIGLVLVWVALRRAWRLITPQQPPTTGGSATTSNGRSPTP
jgi:hypothetical protein